MKRTILLPLLLAVAACNTTGGVDIPPNRLVCANAPPVPSEPITDEKNGTYLRKLHGAWADCKAAVNWIKAYVTPK